MSQALFAYPWMLVTPKVWRVVRDVGVTSFDWLPICVDESDGWAAETPSTRPLNDKRRAPYQVSPPLSIRP